LREVQALAALSSSHHIVRYFDAWIEDDLLYIQLEFCKGCSLAEMVDKFKPQPVSEPTLCKILCHLAQVRLVATVAIGICCGTDAGGWNRCRR